MSEWKTIDSAPKDGTHILGASEKYVHESWFVRDKIKLDSSGSFYNSLPKDTGIGKWFIDHNTFFIPTHWMPLPEPPK